MFNVITIKALLLEKYKHSPFCLQFDRVRATSNYSEPSRKVQELNWDHQLFAWCSSSSVANWKRDLTPCLEPICSLQIYRAAVSNLLRTVASIAPAFSGFEVLRSHGMRPKKAQGKRGSRCSGREKDGSSWWRSAEDAINVERVPSACCSPSFRLYENAA